VRLGQSHPIAFNKMMSHGLLSFGWLYQCIAVQGGKNDAPRELQ
jgi:hypothetical protein